MHGRQPSNAITLGSLKEIVEDKVFRCRWRYRWDCKHLGQQEKTFNLSCYSDHFPSDWKEAYIRPILRKGIRSNRKLQTYQHPKLYWKALERIITKRLFLHLESNSLLAQTQTGYRQHWSTEDQPHTSLMLYRGCFPRNSCILWPLKGFLQSLEGRTSEIAPNRCPWKCVHNYD